MSKFWKDCAGLWKLSRADQMDKLKQWSSEMKVTKQFQTKPGSEFPSDKNSNTSSATKIVISVDEEKNEDDVVKEAVDNGTDFRRTWDFVNKSQHEQVSEIRKWSEGLSLGLTLSQTQSTMQEPEKSADGYQSSLIDMICMEDGAGNGNKEGVDEENNVQVQTVVASRHDEIASLEKQLLQ